MFYLIEITSYTNKETIDKAIYSYTDQIKALGAFHQKLGGAMNNETFKSELCKVIDGRGATLAVDYFERETDAE